jgi:ribosomal-protein-alanine N-acetyltransferase
MTKDDLPQVGAIDKEAFPTQWPPVNYRSELQNKLAHYMVVLKGGVYTQTEIKPRSGILSRIKELFGGRSPVTQIVREELVVGFGGCWLMANEDHITELAVRGSYQRQGVAHLLLVSLIELGLRYRTRLATLEVRASNIAAQKLYEKFGFEKVGLRKAYYNDNKEDALIMTVNDITLPAYQLRLAGIKKDLVERWGVTRFPTVQGKDASG